MEVDLKKATQRRLTPKEILVYYYLKDRSKTLPRVTLDGVVFYRIDIKYLCRECPILNNVSSLNAFMKELRLRRCLDYTKINNYYVINFLI